MSPPNYDCHRLQDENSGNNDDGTPRLVSAWLVTFADGARVIVHGPGHEDRVKAWWVRFYTMGTS